MKKSDKRGSHVGFAIAFVVFVSFVIFLFTMLKPALQIEEDKEFLLAHLKDKIIENVSADLIMISILSNNYTADCLEVNLNDFELGNLNEENFIVKNEFGVSVDFRKESSTLSIKNLGHNFSKIYASDETFPSYHSLPFCEPVEDFEIGLVRTDKYVFQSKVRDLITYYHNNYSTLKEDWNIPKANDFGFSLVYANKSEIIRTEKELPSGVSVYADYIDDAETIVYVDKDANLKVGLIKVIAW